VILHIFGPQELYNFLVIVFNNLNNRMLALSYTLPYDVHLPSTVPPAAEPIFATE
jgi:hypothetical protein